MILNVRGSLAFGHFGNFPVASGMFPIQEINVRAGGENVGTLKAVKAE